MNFIISFQFLELPHKLHKIRLARIDFTGWN